MVQLSQIFFSRLPFVEQESSRSWIVRVDGLDTFLTNFGALYLTEFLTDFGQIFKTPVRWTGVFYYWKILCVLDTFSKSLKTFIYLKETFDKWMM